MSTQVAYGVDAIPETRTAAKPKSASLLQRVFDRLLAAREAQANRYLVDYLSALSDARLAELGYTDHQIRQIRSDRRLPETSNG